MNTHSHRDFVKALGLGAAAGMTRPARAESPAGKRPNLVLVMTDDQGYGDLGCHGNPVVKTPNIDRFHGESMRFTDFHVSPTCAPTRCSLMTGRHEFRSGVTHTIFERERMALTATTVAQVLKSAGYTTGIFGKWHLGDEDPYQPDRRGFDEVFIHGGGGIGQTYPGSCGDAPGNKYFDPAIKHNGVFEKTKGYCTDLFFDRATKWIGEKRSGNAPFFAYVVTNAPHGPLVCPEEYQQPYAAQGLDEKVAAFFGMITNIDDNFGKLMAKLKEWDLEQDTLVIFMTDNGGTAGVKVFNAGMRGGKGTPYNGGTRVPAFWRWPGVVPAEVDVDRLTAHLDLFPTFAELAGAKIPAGVKLDGRSLLPLLQDRNAPWADRYLFTHLGRWPKGQAAQSKYLNCSVRTTRYNLVCTGKGEKKWELYDLTADPGERTNLVAQHPEVVSEMEAFYGKWWEETLPCLVNEDAVGPAVNPFKEQYWKQFGGAPTEVQR